MVPGWGFFLRQQVKLREMKPGMLSREPKEATGMLDGATLPWLINMQRYGPPPSYPLLKIPGVNAPISLGATFGYQPREWGKHPVYEDSWGLLWCACLIDIRVMDILRGFLSDADKLYDPGHGEIALRCSPPEAEPGLQG